MKIIDKPYLLAILLFFITALSCKTDKPQSDLQQVTKAVGNWNEGLNSHDTDAFGLYYADNVSYYGQKLTKNEVLATKLNFINSHPDFTQSVTGDISVKKISDSVYIATFGKQATYSGKQINVEAYVTLKKENGGWRIIAESDNVTEEKLQKEKAAKEEREKQVYEFEQKVTVTGELSTISYKDGAGNKLQVYILKLKHPIDVKAPNTNYDAQENVAEIQLGFADDAGKSSYIGKEITVTGEIYGEETINDRRPVVMIQAHITE